MLLSRCTMFYSGRCMLLSRCAVLCSRRTMFARRFSVPRLSSAMLSPDPRRSRRQSLRLILWHGNSNIIRGYTINKIHHEPREYPYKY